MSVILVLVLLSILVAGTFLGAFVWAIKNGQYEDTFSPAVRILFENNKADSSQKHKNNPNEKNQDGEISASN